MTALNVIIMAIFGLAAGSLTSAGYFAVITGIGLVNRVAAVTKTENKIIIYEEMLIFGAFFGDVLSTFDIVQLIYNADILNGQSGIYQTVFKWIGIIMLVLYGIFAGMFVGLLVVSLAETTKALPIFIRRVRIGFGLGIIILMIGLGKAVGHLIFYLLF